MTGSTSLSFLFLVCSASLPTHLILGQDTEIDSPQTDVRLVWADEFESDGKPDPDNWNYEYGFVRNNELQWYQPDNNYIESGLLIIEGRREQMLNPNYNPESDNWRENREYAEYTSTSMRTRGLHSWQFGRFEMRARIDTREGLWPAFWTLGISGQWPENGEIDIMEYYDGHLLANAAWGSVERWTPVWDDSKLAVSELDEGWPDEFHIWRMDWNKDYIRIYVDDLLLNEIDLSKTINPDGTNPFHQPHYIIVNLAIGGHAGGDPSNTDFPSRYEIDYIRVYEWLNK